MEFQKVTFLATPLPNIFAPLWVVPSNSNKRSSITVRLTSFIFCDLKDDYLTKFLEYQNWTPTYHDNDKSFGNIMLIIFRVILTFYKVKYISPYVKIDKTRVKTWWRTLKALFWCAYCMGSNDLKFWSKFERGAKILDKGVSNSKIFASLMELLLQTLLLLNRHICIKRKLLICQFYFIFGMKHNYQECEIWP